MKQATREVLSAGELEDLKGLEADLRMLCWSWTGIMGRFARARRPQVPDRLACVLVDCLVPALRDLESIAVDASGPAHPAKRRRADGNQRTDRSSR